MNTSRAVVNAFIRIPRDFKAHADARFEALLMRSGYIQEHETVDERMIESALRAHPEFVRDWLEHSENKRTSAGWFIRTNASGSWEVGYLERGAFNRNSSYQDEVAACAAFIKREVDAVMTSGA